jgi:UDP-2,3-diacylglucosamine pyrophosphatase LpxH
MLTWPTDKTPQRIAFISDLHLFSGRSTADRHRDAMLDAASRAELVVFGGDLFDIRWSRVGGHNATAQAAVDWLERFTQQAGKREYVFLYGNHDGDVQLRQALVNWAGTRHDFFIAGDLFRVDDIVMLHGDAIEGRGDAAALVEYRDRWARKPQATLVQSRAYDAAVATGAHRLVAAVAHRRRRTFTRLLRYLDQHDCGHAQGIRHIVFGHTHRFVPGLSFGGVRFYNPGATVRGVPFKPVTLDLGQTV